MNVNSLFKEVKSLIADQKDMKLSSFLQSISGYERAQDEYFL